MAALGVACAATAAQAQCLPAEFNGGGTPAVLEFNAAGAAVAWWCPDRFKPKLSLYALRWDALTPALHAELQALLRASDKREAIERMREEHADTPLLDPRLAEVWRPARERILATRPPAPRWVVASAGNGAPAFRLVRGQLLADNTQLNAGRACDCTKDGGRLIENETVYCLVEPPLVAACVPGN